MCTTIGGDPTATKAPSSAGPIAGGVIGGIVVVCFVTFLIWRFCIKKRRQQYDEQIWHAAESEKGDSDYHPTHKRTGSMHSVKSIASTVLTRASNVIQIAYIPGVTNRSVESTPELIPPVPPIPAMSALGSVASTPHQAQDEHFFLPSNLRDSTYSDYTVDRTSYARSSMAPSMNRSSVPSTAYRGSAVVHNLPAQTAVRYKANPVAVKSNERNSPSDISRSNTPPVPITDRAQQQSISTNTTSPIIARLGVPKAVTVTRSNGNLAAAAAAQKTPSPVPSERSQANMSTLERKGSIAESRHDGTSSTFDDASSDEDSPADRSLMGHEKLQRFSRRELPGSPVKSPSSAPDLRLTPSPVYPPSSPDSFSKAKKKQHKRSGSLNQIIEEATRRATKEPRHGGLGSVGSATQAYDRDMPMPESREGPFSDSHAARTP